MVARDAVPDTSVSLMLAVIASSETPMLLLAGDLTVIAASTSFYHAFDIWPADVPGRLLTELGDGEWRVPQLASLLAATASGAAEVHAYEMDLLRPKLDPRHLVLNAHKLNYDDKDQVRLLVAVADVTEARASERQKDELIREKAILLREVQHRIANSLQIIASLLLQSARKVQSDETRNHLNIAHGRVMSIASVQRQLAASDVDEVPLRAYLTQLCQSLGASMIPDGGPVTIEVDVDGSSVDGARSVSLGLIVTELVINALKHAFPDESKGRIMVDYQSRGPNWTLLVGDNGVGMPPSNAVQPGLGTSIVEALARQLKAEVQVIAAHPGTSVCIIHDPVHAIRPDEVSVAV